MRRALVLLALVGCSGPPADPFPRIDAVVYDDRIAVYPRDVDGGCDCNTAELPPVGGCATLTDVPGCGCEPPPASCLVSVAVEDRSGVVASGDWIPADGVIELAVEIDQLDAPELVAVGCGGELRAPLAVEAPASPVIAEVVYDEVDLGLVADDVGGASYLGGFDHGFGGTVCRATPAELVAVPAPFSFEYGQPDTFLYALASEAAGAVTVHRARGDRVDNVFLPNDTDDGRWTLPIFVDRAPSISVTIDGTTTDDRIALSFAAVDLAGAEPLVELVGSGFASVMAFRYRAAAAGDELSITTSGGTLSGVVEHAAALDPLDVGGPEQDLFHVRLAGVELVWEGGGTAVVTVDLTWELGVVARPVGAVSGPRR